MTEPVENLTDFQEAIWTFYELYPENPHPADYIHRLLSLQELA